MITILEIGSQAIYLLGLARFNEGSKKVINFEDYVSKRPKKGL